MSSKNTNNKSGGRPHGSITCRRVKFKDLKNHIGDEGTVLASQAWLQACGVPYEDESPKD